MNSIISKLSQTVSKIVRSDLNLDVELKNIVDITKLLSHGDLVSTAPMRLAKHLRKAPNAIAKDLVVLMKAEIAKDSFLTESVDIVEAMGGFVNITLSHKFWCKLGATILNVGYRYGTGENKNKKVQVEYVSANPTGPLTVAHGRQAAIGDTLAIILDFAGYDVETEYYLNDTGNQIRVLGKSVYIRFLQQSGVDIDFPENCYQGDYINDIAKDAGTVLEGKYNPDDEDEAILAFGRFSCDKILNWIKKDLATFRIEFKNYFSQEKMEESGVVDALVEYYKQNNISYMKEDALWIKSTEYGDVEDRVLVKSDGSYTYRTPDIAYHQNKFARGFDKLVVLLGPDHHAHTLTMKASLKALGLPADDLNYLLVQHCTLYKAGEPIKMSTRKGTFISLQEVIDAVGVDATRLFFLYRSLDTHLDFDLELAVKQAPDNPVFYFQYASARSYSIMARALEEGLIPEEEYRNGYYIPGGETIPNIEDEEIELLRYLGRFPVAVQRAAASLDQMKVLNYLHEIVERFHNYYHRKKVIVEDPNLARPRLAVISAFRTVLVNCFYLLEISAPTKM